MRRVVLGISLCTFSMLSAQLTVDPSMTPEDYVLNVLLGGGVVATNITFNGNPGNVPDPNFQIGSFDGSVSNVGINQGIVISSGDINVCVGPNDEGGATLGTANGGSDPDLNTAAAATTFDAAVLEFDFIPAGDSINFRFVFGSEEYLEFVNAGYNDAFGFFLSGPGIAGPYTNAAENIALVPGTTTPVTIDNVNDIVNSLYYVDNGDGFTAPFNTDPTYIQFDGFTTVLTARAQVQCGETYHIKLAIADAGDAILDSGVFLEAGSFNSVGVVTVNIAAVSANGTMVEGCTDAELVLSRPDTIGDLLVNLTLGGTATNGLDYTQIPTPITIPSGSSSITFPLSAIQDNMVDSPEDIIFTTWYVNACGDTAYNVASITILEYEPIMLMTDPDQILDCSQDSILISAIASGGYQNLYPSWSTGSNGYSTFVPGMSDGTYTITVTDDCNMSATDQVIISSGCEIIIPNVFSPNNDGSNDAFVVQGLLGTQNTVRIWNRWGNLIFETQNYRNNWRASGVPDGTYYYEIIVKGYPLPHTGHLTLLRD